ncbi:MAG: hypothetical protein CM15mP125_1980 [Gammaproteobacteria bacterium]|nr:MAG: hypothetical protein CM15mP125_1980 [Gammaproteobacteria bacterium]
MWGAMRRDVAAMNMALLAVGDGFVAVAFALLAVSFLQDDFSVAVVAANSNSLLPPIFKFSALGKPRGLALLWVLILSGWMTAVARSARPPSGDGRAGAGA